MRFEGQPSLPNLFDVGGAATGAAGLLLHNNRLLGRLPSELGQLFDMSKYGET